MTLSDVTPFYPVAPAARRRLTAARVEPAGPARGPHGHYAAGPDGERYAGRPPFRPLPPHRGRLVDIFV
jgi:hypothetical protein